MKITVNIDEDLLTRAVETSGSATRTEAIHTALKELVRRAELISVLREGTGLTADELKDSLDPDSVSEYFRSRNSPASGDFTNRVAEGAES